MLVAVALSAAAATGDSEPVTRGEEPLVVADASGRFAVAWITTDESGGQIASRVVVMLGRAGSKARVIRTVTPADRNLGDAAISLERSGDAVVTWSDGPLSRGVAPPENWYMARVRRSGDVVPIGHFTGPYFNRGLLRTSRGSLIAVAERDGVLYTSSLKRGGTSFTDPVAGAPVPVPATDLGASYLAGMQATGGTSATLVWMQDRPGARFSPTRLVQQRIRLSGQEIDRPHALSPWGHAYFVSHDATRRKEAVVWGNSLGVWASIGRPGHLRRRRLGSSARLIQPQVLVLPERVFVVARRDDPGTRPYRPGIDPTPRSDIIGAEIGRHGLIHVHRLDRGTRFDFARIVRTASGRSAVGIWRNGSRLCAARFGSHRVGRKVCVRDEDLDSYNATLIGKRRLLVALRHHRQGPVRIRLLRLS